MASCFKNPNKKNLSAKDYTIKKRRNVAFRSVRDSYLSKLASSGSENPFKIGTNVACVNNKGQFTQFMNREVKLDMLRAYEDCNSVLSKLIPGQLFSKSSNICSPYYINKDNSDISNNYTGENIQLAYGDGSRAYLTEYNGGLNQPINSTHISSDYHNTYAEIFKNSTPLDSTTLDTNGKFKNNKFFFRNPLVCPSSNQVAVLLPNDTLAPGISSFQFLIE